MVSLLELIGFLGALAGVFFLTQATMGVGIIAVSASLLILARLLQADKQHKALMNKLEQLEKQSKPASNVAE